MSYRRLESGAIACSAVVLWGWVAPPYTNPEQPCNSSDQPQSDAQNCTSTHSFSLQNVIPEKMSQLFWRSDQAHHVAPELEQVYEKLINNAQQSISRDRMIEALSSLGGIPKNSQHYALAKRLQNDWSQELLQRATQQHQQANIETALKLLRTIPPTSEQYSHAQELMNQWSQEATQLQRAQAAQRKGQWTEVISLLEPLAGRPLYQSSTVQAMLQEAIYRQFEPNNALMQVATSSQKHNSVTPIRQPIITQMPSSEEPVPFTEPLEIDTAQALHWTQPLPSKTIASTTLNQPTPKPPMTDGAQSPVTPLFPYKLPKVTATKSPNSSQPAIAPPETMPDSGLDE